MTATLVLLTVVESMSGGESISFSGNGEWLLVVGSATTTSIEVSTGRWLRLLVGNATW